MKTIAALVCGALFAVGLAISGMAQPAKVIGFLDAFSGAWDPSLAFVMIGAIGVVALSRRFAPMKPLFDACYPELKRAGIDRKLLAGSAIFGLGWGLVGYCPGPAVVSLGAAMPGSLLFCASMLMGMAVFQVSDL
ncbi:MAG TPA: DUF6691 family protein [Polyangia bacterium]|jgi:hypothetical protein|nr:DUF6691 family protein [Polyangia bacterium]